MALLAAPQIDFPCMVWNSKQKAVYTYYGNHEVCSTFFTTLWCHMRVLKNPHYILALETFKRRKNNLFSRLCSHRSFVLRICNLLLQTYINCWRFQNHNDLLYSLISSNNLSFGITLHTCKTLSIFLCYMTPYDMSFCGWLGVNNKSNLSHSSYSHHCQSHRLSASRKALIHNTSILHPLGRHLICIHHFRVPKNPFGKHGIVVFTQ